MLNWALKLRAICLQVYIIDGDIWLILHWEANGYGTTIFALFCRVAAKPHRIIFSSFIILPKASTIMMNWYWFVQLRIPIFKQFNGSCTYEVNGKYYIRLKHRYLIFNTYCSVDARVNELQNLKKCFFFQESCQNPEAMHWLVSICHEVSMRSLL